MLARTQARGSGYTGTPTGAVPAADTVGVVNAQSGTDVRRKVGPRGQ